MCFNIVHLIEYSQLSFVSFQTQLDKAVSFEYLALQNDFLWLLKGVLNGFTVMPIYFFVVLSSAVVMSAW